jgi:hypothetical protein
MLNGRPAKEIWKIRMALFLLLSALLTAHGCFNPNATSVAGKHFPPSKIVIDEDVILEFEILLLGDLWYVQQDLKTDYFRNFSLNWTVEPGSCLNEVIEPIQVDVIDSGKRVKFIVSKDKIRRCAQEMLETGVHCEIKYQMYCTYGENEKPGGNAYPKRVPISLE